MHRKTFANSKRQWKNQSVEGVQSITVWLRNIVSNKPRLKRTEQRHRERVLNASLTKTKKRRRKKDETERGQLKMKGFLSQRRTNHSQTKVGMQHYDPLLHDSWNKKKKHKVKEKQKVIRRTIETRQLPLTGFLSLHHRL